MLKQLLLMSLSVFMHAQTALISVTDKTGLVELATYLCEHGYSKILASSGTAQYLKKNLAHYHDTVQEISDYTGYNELLGGRVKTLHPKIYAGILARDTQDDQAMLAEQKIDPISLIVVNLYPFESVVAQKESTLAQAVENIDIGGVSLVRAAAKNFARVCVLTRPQDYKLFMDEPKTELVRKEFAIKAFHQITQYDAAITSYLSNNTIETRIYNKAQGLKYGLNPHQKNAGLYLLDDKNPLKFLNGEPGYVNMLDALSGWQLVREAHQALGIVCAASFKHHSPAGVGIGTPLTEQQKSIADVEGRELSPSARAYIKARYCDPQSSFGDFVALSSLVDEDTAKLLAREVSDGIIAPAYSYEALILLKKKKGGKYLIIQADPAYNNTSQQEFRELYGVALKQAPNQAAITPDLFMNIVTRKKDIPAQALQDLMLATIALKYTQSNSIACAREGQVFVGAGQQNRIDCVKIASEKVYKNYILGHPQVLEFKSKFKKEIKRPDRINALLQFAYTGSYNPELVTQDQVAISADERRAFLQKLDKVSLSSDAFFPFRDNIETAASYGIKYIAQPGGSMNDADIIKACDEHDIVMAHTNLRLFTH